MIRSKDLSHPNSGKSTLRQRHGWSSNVEYILTHLVYVVYQTRHYQNSAVALGNRVQFASAFLCVLLVCLPVQYMQTMVGQYSQSSAIRLRHMSPIVHGIVFSFLLVSFLRLLREAVIGGDAVLYLFNSMQSGLPWLTCGSQPNCWFDDHCKDGPCLSAKTSLAASKYWNETFMGFQGQHGQSIPDLRRLVTTILIWTAVYVNLFVSKHFSAKFLRYTFVLTLLTRALLLLVLVLVSNHGLIGLMYLFATVYQDLFDIYSWARQMIAMVCYMSIGRGGNILLGSFFAPGHPSGILTVLSIVFITITNVIIMDSYFIAVASIGSYAGLKEPSVMIIQSVHETVEFTLIPAGLGYTTLTPFWSIVYFLTLILHTVFHLIINVRIILITLEDAFPILGRYRKYLLVISYVVYISLSIAFVTSALYSFTFTFLGYSLDLFEAVITLLFVLVVGWIYGVTKFSDDIHFIIGSQPAQFWKVTWYLNPIFICVGLVFYIIDAESQDFLGAHGRIFVLVTEFVLISPVLILGAIEVFKYLRVRNFGGVFQMTDEWGPANQMERHERKIFNPRKETKSRRRYDMCQHKCLLKSTMLSHVITEEILWTLDADGHDEDSNYDED